MIRLKPHVDGVIVTVRAYAGARRNGITGEHDGMLKVAVTQAPEKGKANQAIADILSQTFRIRKAQIELTAGHTSSQKRFLLRDVTVEDVKRALQELLA
jgi:uncharacterized protein (TIGR00251 family)